MKRFILPSFLLFGAVKFTEWVSERLKVQIDYNWFGVGLFVALIVALLYFLIVDWWGTVTRPSHPQTITLKTTETPNQITRASFWAIVKAIGLVGGILFFLYLLSAQ